jgi:predicted N-acetyltransferase YhbS
MPIGSAGRPRLSRADQGTSGLARVALAGEACRAAATTLLLAARAEDAMAGLYEAADLQWWSTADHELVALEASFWRGPDGWAAVLLAADDGATIAADLLWRPSCERRVRGKVMDTALAALAALGRVRGRPVGFTARDDDADLARRLGKAGFARDPGEDVVQMVRGPGTPPAAPLPAGLALVDGRGGGGPFPRLARRSAEAACALRAASLYDPALDLAVVTPDGTVAAHALCWLDRANGIGLFEPLRTEEAFQRQGLGRALMAAGLARLSAGGARLIKVSHHAGNDAARALYRDAGFVPAFAKRGYRRPSED